MSVRTQCAVADQELHKQERLIQAKLSKNPQDVRLKSKLGTIRKQIAAEKARCTAEARRERSVRNAEAKAEKHQFDVQRRHAREGLRTARIARKREAFELRRARKEAGEITGRDIGMYGLAAAGVAGVVGLLYAFG